MFTRKPLNFFLVPFIFERERERERETMRMNVSEGGAETEGGRHRI